MAITIKRTKNERGVKLGSLNIGDTFMYDNRVGVIAQWEGRDFPLDLTTCTPMYHKDSMPFARMISPETIVLPVEVEMTYKVVG